jgi:hypothetical protein
VNVGESKIVGRVVRPEGKSFFYVRTADGGLVDLHGDLDRVVLDACKDAVRESTHLSYREGSTQPPAGTYLRLSVEVIIPDPLVVL